MIKINTKTINLDVSKKLYEKLVAKQGDTQSRFLLFNLSSNGAAINLTNRSVRVYAVKPDSKEVFNDLVVSDPVRGACILELTNQVLAIPGVVKMELMITEGTKKLTSFEFELEIIKKLNNETSIVSTNEFTALANGLASLNEYDSYKNEIKGARGSFLSLLARLNHGDTQLNLKANNTDNNRTTTAKDVTGAINELHANAKEINVKAYMTTAQSVANNTDTILYMNGVFFDEDGMFDSSKANRLTVKEPGIYDIKAFITFASNSIGKRILRISKNGSGASNSIRQVSVYSLDGEGTSVFANTLYKLSAADFLICEVLQNCGASLNVLNATFEIVKVG